MNVKMIGRINALILAAQTLFMLQPLFISLFYSEYNSALSFAKTIMITAAASVILLFLCRKAPRRFYAREGLVTVGLAWIAMSLFGCLPFFISKEIPNFADALFEMVSGFTTTGASILKDVEALSHGALYWRSFSHWVGGMGVLVFVLAVIPLSSRSEGFSVHILKAESPGPDVGKLVPRIKQTAAITYMIYIALTAADLIMLLLGGMKLFDAVCIAVGTAGTGGFAVRNDGLASYSPYIQYICTLFMFLFGVNFSCYFMVLRKNVKNVLKDEELRFYVSSFVLATILISINIRSFFPTAEEVFRHSSFTVSSLMTTTGFSTTDFNKWPSFSKSIMLILMMIGASAGSTGGGLKASRALILIKNVRRNVNHYLHPSRVATVKMNGRYVSEEIINNTTIYFSVYMFIIVASVLLVSIDNYSVTTNISAVISCFNNIGPGLDSVGPTSNFSGYSVFSKLVLTFDMLAGRLEIFPIMSLLTKSTWKRL